MSPRPDILKRLMFRWQSIAVVIMNYSKSLIAYRVYLFLFLLGLTVCYLYLHVSRMKYFFAASRLPKLFLKPLIRYTWCTTGSSLWSCTFRILCKESFWQLCTVIIFLVCEVRLFPVNILEWSQSYRENLVENTLRLHLVFTTK